MRVRAVPQAMSEFELLLKPGGLLFLGVPVGLVPRRSDEPEPAAWDMTLNWIVDALRSHWSPFMLSPMYREMLTAVKGEAAAAQAAPMAMKKPGRRKK